MRLMGEMERFGLFTKEETPVPLTGVRVNGSITGRAARVSVTQRFENREDKAIEAVYKFPLPEGSSVCGFTVATGDRTLRGRVEERDKAFAEYDDALAQGHGAFLLDEERPNIFTLSVGNVKPRHAVDIEVSYVTALEANGAEVRFMLPTTISPRYTPADMPDLNGVPVDKLVNPELRLDVPYGLRLHLEVAGPKSIAGIECPSHPIRTTYNDDVIVVEFSADTVKMDHDFVLTITYRTGFTNRAYTHADGDHRYVQLDFTPGMSREDGFLPGGQDTALPPPPSEVIFLLDCSGSMQGPSIGQAKKALEAFLRGMSAGTRFNVYRFGSTFSSLFPETVTYDEKNLKIALRLLDGVQADLGGTELNAPLREIYGRAPGPCLSRSIVLLTDGQVGNESDILRLVQSEPHTRLFAVGIGLGPNEYLVRKLATLSGGAVEFVAPGERIEPKVLRLFAKVTQLPLEAIAVDWGASAEQAPLEPVVYREECVSLLARIPRTAAAPSEVTVHGRQSGVGVSWRIPVAPVDGADSALPQLWARARIGDLEAGVVTAGGSRQRERRDTVHESQLVELSKRYGILCRATSFITVEYRTDAEKSTGEIELRKVPSMLTRGWGGIAGASLPAVSQGYVLNCPSYPDLKRMSTHRPMRYPSAGRPAHASDAAELHISCVAYERRGSTDELGTDALAGLLALQSAGGGFDAPDVSLARRLGLNMAELRELAGRVKHGGADPLKLVCTAVVLAALELRFASRRGQWFAVTRKSRLWLEAEVKRLRPTVDGKPLDVWATEYVRAAGAGA